MLEGPLALQYRCVYIRTYLRVFSPADHSFLLLETMQWSHPEVQGDIPPPCRAHTATLVDRRIVIFGGGEGPVYYDTVYILDTVHRRWQKVEFPADAPHPTTRRAHTAVYYDGKIWVFGGGNGSQALNDVWTLTVNCPVEKMSWNKVEIRGSKQPGARGYHTANLVRNIMIVVGGSDGRECFSDIWCLNLGEMRFHLCERWGRNTHGPPFTLDTLRWDQVRLETAHRRLSHSVTQVGSYLFIIGGHDGNSYSSDILFFNLGKPKQRVFHSVTQVFHPSLASVRDQSGGGSTIISERISRFASRG